MFAQTVCNHRALCFMLVIVLFFSAGLFVSSQDSPPKTPSAAIHAFENIMQQPHYKNAHWGILVVDCATGQPLFEVNADRLFLPASTTKLYSTAAFLDTFGADFRYRTPVVHRGEIKDGELNGDLVLVASGDPTMGGRTDDHDKIQFSNIDHTYANGSLDSEPTKANPLAGLQSLAKQVAAKGIKSIKGQIIIDDRLFDSAEGTGSGPKHLTPIMINDNVIDIMIKPDKEVGQAASVETRPRTAAYLVDAQIETVEAGKPLQVRSSSPMPGRLVVRGQIPKGHKPVLRVHEVDDPATFARALFIDELKRAGVRLQASHFERNSTASLPSREQVVQWPPLAEFTSPPASEEIKLVLKVSHNLHASTLPLMLAVKHNERTLEKGLRREGQALRKLGVDIDSIALGSGAGGARTDLTSPRVTVQLLLAMRKHATFDVYKPAMPILGVDGTLYNVLEPDSPAKGQFHAKTGTYYLENELTGRYILTSKALAGYGTTQSGRQVAFALFVNYTHLMAPSGSLREGKTLAKFCEAIYKHF